MLYVQVNPYSALLVISHCGLCTLAHGFWISRKGGTGGGGWGHLVGDMHMVTASLGSWLGPGELLNLFINALSGPGFSFGVRA